MKMAAGGNKIKKKDLGAIVAWHCKGYGGLGKLGALLGGPHNS